LSVADTLTAAQLALIRCPGRQPPRELKYPNNEKTIT
jgi:hypothetical protein